MNNHRDHHAASNGAPLEADEARIDALARRSAGELRRPAPTDGFATIRRSGRRHQVIRAALSGTAVLAVLVGGAFAMNNRDRNADVAPATEPAVVASTPRSVTVSAPDTTPPPGVSVTPRRPVQVEFRPVLGRMPTDKESGPSLLIPPTDDRDAAVQLRQGEYASVLRLGPVFASNKDMVESAKAEFTNGEWQVVLGLTADGLKVWNAWVAECFDRGPRCAEGGMAIVLDDVVVSAPTPSIRSFDPAEITITGGTPGLTESDAQALADALKAGAAADPTSPTRLPADTPVLPAEFVFPTAAPPATPRSIEPTAEPSTTA